MTYNAKHFSAELNIKLSAKLDALQLWQNHVLEFLIKYLVASNYQQQLSHCDSFLQLLAKMRFNLESANLLLPAMNDDYRFKTSINLLYRAIIDDVINSYYLFCTVALADLEQHALNNELSIFHKEFILSTIKGINADREFEKFIDTIKNVQSTADIDVEEEFKTANPELLNTDRKWKKNKDIRASTHPDFLPLFNQGTSNTFISESKKLEFIKVRGVTTHHNLEAIFKYLSQYQHFSPKAHDLLNAHIEIDIEMYQRTLGELVMLLNQLLAFLVLKDKEGIKKYWDALAPLVFNSFAE